MQIKTYNPQKSATLSLSKGYHFYVLCKGNNSGRPSAIPCPNCFIVSTDTQEEKETLYWLTYAMWKGKALHPYLRGSVIPFISIRDYRRQLIASAVQIQHQNAGFSKMIQVLQQLDIKEANAREQITTIGQVRIMVFRKLLPTN